MTRRILIRCFLVMCLVQLAPATTAVFAQDVSQSRPRGTMLWISDVHFDPFYGHEVSRLANDAKDGWRNHTEWGQILAAMPGNRQCSPSGSDANNFLLLEVLNRAASVLNPKPDCILITGDFLSHNFSNDYFTNHQLPASLTTAELHNRFIDQTMAYLALCVSQAFPKVPVIAALGNNDAYCGDYEIRGNSGFLTNTRKTFQKYLLPELSADFETFGGCYTTRIPGTKHRFVVLNSVPFISDYPESFRLTGIPPLNSQCSPLRTVDLVDEFDWLMKWGEPFAFTKTYARPDVSAKSLDGVFSAMKSGATAPSGMTYLDQYFFDYSTRNGAKNSKPRTHYKKALGSILGP